MTYSATRILNSLQRLAGARSEPRSQPDGYFRVFGPSAGSNDDCWVIVEKLNGAVSLREPIASQLGAQPRPAGTSISSTAPIGASSGPNYGLFDKALVPAIIHSRFPQSEDDFVRAILGAFLITKTPW